MPNNDRRDELKGFVHYNEIVYPFVYADGVISLFPSDYAAWKREQGRLMDAMFGTDQVEETSNIRLRGEYIKQQRDNTLCIA